MIGVGSHALKPLPPTSGPMPSSAAHSVAHHRSQRFTSHILTHGGPARDTTIQAATQAEKRKQQHFAHQCSSMDMVMTEFEAEVVKVNALKKDIVNTQRLALQFALQWHCSIVIQQFVRREYARRKLKVLIKRRFINDWLRFRLYYRRRCRFARQLSRWARHCLQQHKLLILLKSGYAARKIQRRYRQHRRVIALFLKMKLLKRVKRAIEHIMLFGVRRAVRHVVARIHESEVAAAHSRILRKFLECCIRKTRRAFLNSPLHGKIVFHILSNFFTDEKDKNFVIEHIRKKIESPGDSKQRKAVRRPARVSRNQKKSKTEQTVKWTASDLPFFVRGCFRMRSIFDAFEMLTNLIAAARANPSMLDDSVPVLPSKSSFPNSTSAALSSISHLNGVSNASASAAHLGAVTALPTGVAVNSTLSNRSVNSPIRQVASATVAHTRGIPNYISNLSGSGGGVGTGNTLAGIGTQSRKRPTVVLKRQTVSTMSTPSSNVRQFDKSSLLVSVHEDHDPGEITSVASPTSASINKTSNNNILKNSSSTRMRMNKSNSNTSSNSSADNLRKPSSFVELGLEDRLESEDGSVPFEWFGSQSVTSMSGPVDFDHSGVGSSSWLIMNNDLQSHTAKHHPASMFDVVSNALRTVHQTHGELFTDSHTSEKDY